jgi:ADP-heptose:LPS heptosyltransferase
VPVPDWSSRRWRVLFIRDDGIGDLMVTMEVMRAITEKWPTVTLDVLASPGNAAFARTLPFVNEVIVHRRGFLLSAWPTWRTLRRNRYDVVIDGRVAIRNVNKQTTMLLLSSGAPVRIGLAGRRNDRVYSLPVRMERIEHWVDAHAALAGPFGINPSDRDWRPRLPLSDHDRARGEAVWSGVGAGRPRVIVNPYSASADRQWPLERFAPVIRHVRNRLPNASIIIPTMPAGSPGTAGLAKEGAAAVPLSLGDVTAVTAAADLVISPDTAITVIASGFRVPVVALMRAGTAQWVPYRADGEVAFSDDPRSLAGLPVDRVVATIDRVIDSLGRSKGWI